MDLKIVSKVAHLSKLELSPAELQSYGDQLEKILGFFKEIETIDTSAVKPLLTPVEIEQYLRPDEITEKLTTQEQLMAVAPDKQGFLYKVPPVV